MPKSQFTPWFPMSAKPVRNGEYEGREKRSRLRLPVHWRKLTDEKHYGWYFDKGHLGPFHLWECAKGKITAWRGLTKDSND